MSLTKIIKSLSHSIALGLALAGSSLNCGDGHRPVVGGGGTSGGGQPCIDELCRQKRDDGGIKQKPLNKIGFVSNRSGSDEIYMMDPDGSNVERLTYIAEKNPGLQYNIGRISRSPDGRLFFDSNLDGDWDLYKRYRDTDGKMKMMNLTQEPVDMLTGEPVRRFQDRNPAFLPDGTLLHDSDLKGHADIFLRYLDKRIIKGPINLTENGAIDESPHSSQDGRHIAFTSTRSDPYPEIHIMDDYGEIYGGETRRLPEGGFSDGSPCWSPQWSPTGDLAYHCEANGNVDIYKTRITDESNEQSILTSDPSREHSPSYSPGGEQMAYVSDEDGDEEIWAMDDNGRNPRKLTDNMAEDHSPAWW